MRCAMPAAVLTILIGAIVTASGGEAELSRVKSEWPAAARRLEEAFVQVRGTARLWTDRTESPRASGKSFLDEARFALDHGMEKVELARFTRGSKPTKVADYVYCVGEGTAFRIHRRDGAEGYEIEGVGAAPMDRILYSAVFGRFIHASHGVVGRPISNFLEEPTLEIVGAEAVERDGENWIKVDCAIGFPETKDRVSFVLAPEDGWAVQSCQINYHYDPNRPILYEIEYGAAHGGVPLPRYVKLSGENPGVVNHCEFTGWEFASTPIAEFNMTHYGLPDLVRARKPRGTLAYWLVGFAVLVGISAFVLRRAASRRATTA